MGSIEAVCLDNGCPICGDPRIELLIELDNCVDSSGEGVKAAAATYYCENCQNFFKRYTSLDRSKKIMRDIYEDYVLHSINEHKETRVRFDLVKEGIPKSQHIFNYLISRVCFPDTGTFLDIGCHFGALLRVFHRYYPNWQLYGADISSRFEKEISNIGENSTYYSEGIPVECETKFSLIALTHVLEHMENLHSALHHIHGLLSNDGVLLIACNAAENNPLLALIFEQFYNFTESGIRALLASNGFQVVDFTSSWINKEIILLAKKLGKQYKVQSSCMAETYSPVEGQHYWRSLMKVIKEARDTIAIFGATYAGRWLAANVFDCAFFVDEDESKQGTHIDGVLVLAPDQVPVDMPVWLLFPSNMARRIADRLKPYTKGCFCLPPNFVMEI